MQARHHQFVRYFIRKYPLALILNKSRSRLRTCLFNRESFAFFTPILSYLISSHMHLPYHLPKPSRLSRHYNAMFLLLLWRLLLIFSPSQCYLKRIIDVVVASWCTNISERFTFSTALFCSFTISFPLRSYSCSYFYIECSAVVCAAVCVHVSIDLWTIYEAELHMSLARGMFRTYLNCGAFRSKWWFWNA